MNKKDRGRAAEEAAAQYLTQQGLVVLRRNFRAGRLEVDIVAAEANTLVIVEVKTADPNLAGVLAPVKPPQEERLREAAEVLLEVYPEFSEVRLDMVLVAMNKTQPSQIVHVREAFGAMH
jgi:putative endonuclease